VSLVDTLLDIDAGVRRANGVAIPKIWEGKNV